MTTIDRRFVFAPCRFAVNEEFELVGFLQAPFEMQRPDAVFVDQFEFVVFVTSHYSVAHRYLKKKTGENCVRFEFNGDLLPSPTAVFLIS